MCCADRGVICLQRNCSLARQTERLYIKHYTVTQHCFISACIILEGELHTTMTFNKNELPWKCLWKSYFWKGNVHHKGHLEHNSKILSLFISTKLISLHFFFLTFCLNLQCVHIRSWDKTETNLVLNISRSCPGQYILWHANTLEKLTVLAAVSESVVEKKTNNIKVVLRSLNKQANFQFVIAL